MEEKESKSEHHEKKEESSRKKNFKMDSWMIASAVLGVLVILLLGIMVYPKVTGNVISTKAAEAKMNKFIASVGVDANITNITTKGDLYEIFVSIQGSEVPIYMTKDGKYLAQGLVPIDEQINANANNTAEVNVKTEVTKSDKPLVELFVFTYCPYGLQMEKAFAPVYDLLGKKADIKIIQIGAMHGDFEKVEAERQLCILNQYDNAKLWAYLKAFDADTAIGDCNGDATCVAPKITAIYTKLGISATKIDACMKNSGEDLYNLDVQYSSSKGVSGSPTVFINGASVQLDRSPNAVKTAVCDAFTTAPAECSKNLSTSASSPSFGASTGSSASAAQCS
jgi:hypothetical protein